MIASGNKGWFPYSNQCAKYFLKETCGFSGHVSDRQAFAGGRKKSTGRRATECRQTETTVFAAGFFLFSAAVFDKSLSFINFIGLPAFEDAPGRRFS
jgi:hypothetical protein